MGCANVKMPVVYVVRGIEGSGRYFEAENVATTYGKNKTKILDMNAYFNTIKYNSDLLIKAQAWNLKRFENELKSMRKCKPKIRKHCIVICQPFITKNEIIPFVQIAKQQHVPDFYLVEPTSYRWVEKNIEACHKMYTKTFQNSLKILSLDEIKHYAQEFEEIKTFEDIL